ncbi:MAG: alpha/beta fold hydrolase [Deltaproteobacteria bacterium]|jgi:predicted dienelactone hydrolase|nr:alpha/beta fold hydrolase [Deltaproteobacteria bacterium]MBW2532488.1 alpha/beta fold hydrolase [Deltaproteobacteria bacterium]
MSVWWKLGGVVLACTAGCSDDPAVSPEPAAPPEPLPGLPLAHPSEPGPFRVGVTTLFTSDADDLGRVLPVEVWYPATPADDAPIATHEFIVGVLELAAIDSPMGAVRDAPADLRGAPHPVVLFSHGFGGIRFQSLFLTEFLASHGFVVAAPDHLGNTFAEMVVASSALESMTVAQVRPHDVARALDLLLEESQTWPGILYQLADPHRVGVAGHSFGGFTALRIAGASVDPATIVELCRDRPDEALCDGVEETELEPSARDERIQAALALAPGAAIAFDGSGLGDVAVPTMIQAGTMDRACPFEEEALEPFEHLPSPAHLVGIDRGGHFSFTGLCPVLNDLGLGDDFDDGCGEANIEPTLAYDAIDEYATAFFQTTLLGDGSAADCLDPRARNRPGVSLRRSK